MKNPISRGPISARQVLFAVSASLLSLSVHAANLTRDNGAAVVTIRTRKPPVRMARSCCKTCN